jgi:hypothetical protein
MFQAWYLLGPIARYCNVGERIAYEFAGAKMFASRFSDRPGDIKVEFEDVGLETVCNSDLS